MEKRVQKTGRLEEREPPIHSVHLNDRIAGGQDNHTIVSVLRPRMRVERTKDLEPDDPSKKPEAHYRIILTFRLQVEIRGFDKRFLLTSSKWQRSTNV